MNNVKIGSMLRSKGSNKLYIFLGEPSIKDYARFGITKLKKPRQEELHLTDDVLIFDLLSSDYIIVDGRMLADYFTFVA